MNQITENPMTQTKYDNFFTPLENDAPYVKIGIEGEAGSGKTFTLANIFEGLYRRLKSTKPIVIFDTERASKFLRPRFEKAGIPVIVKKSRTLADLIKTMQYCDEGNADLLFVDSITNVSQQFVDDYLKKTNKKAMTLRDWGVVIPLWSKEFAYRMILANHHFGFTGRQGFTYSMEENEDTGRKEWVKTGVKMKVLGETAYEPDVLILMERFEKLISDKKEIYRLGTIIKDRSDLIDGRTFKNPTYEDFEPVVELILSDAIKETITASNPNSDIFGEDEDGRSNRRRKDILLENNENLLDKVAAGTTKEAKTLRLALKEYAYHGESSGLAIAEMTEAELEEGKSRLKVIVGLIEQVDRAENIIYGNPKAIDNARNKYLEGEKNLGKCEIPKLEDYLQHMAEKNQHLADAVAADGSPE